MLKICAVRRSVKKLYAAAAIVAAITSPAQGADLSAPGVDYQQLHSFSPWTGKTGLKTGGVAPTGELVQTRDGLVYGVGSYGGRYNCGTIYRIDAASAVQIVYSFRCQPGGGWPSPKGALVEAADGSLYGTTAYGGAESVGSVFRFGPDGRFAEIHSFSREGAEGRNPPSGLTIAPDGSLYGVTSAGPGAVNAGTVFKLGADGVPAVLLDFSSAADPQGGTRPAASLIVGSDGWLYGTTVNGGAFSRGTAFRLSTQGRLVTLHHFRGGKGDGQYPAGRLLQASDGQFYGVTTTGGPADRGVVYRLANTAGNTLLKRFDSAASEGHAPTGALTQGQDGRLYGTTVGNNKLNDGTSFDGTVYALTLSGTLTTLQWFEHMSLFDDPAPGPLAIAPGQLLGTTPMGGEVDAGRAYGLRLVTAP